MGRNHRRHFKGLLEHVGDAPLFKVMGDAGSFLKLRIDYAHMVEFAGKYGGRDAFVCWAEWGDVF